MLSQSEREYLMDIIVEGALGNMASANANINQKKVELSQAKTDRIKANPLNKVNPLAYRSRAKEHIKRGVAGFKRDTWNKVASKVGG